MMACDHTGWRRALHPGSAEAVAKVEGGNAGGFDSAASDVDVVPMDCEYVPMHQRCTAGGGSFLAASGLVSNVWYRIPFNQSALSVSNFQPTDSHKIRPGPDS